MDTLYTAIAIFSLTALIGMYLLSLILRNKETPKGLSFIHGIFAVSGIALLIYYCLTADVGPLESLILFGITAGSGLILLYKDLTGKKIPKWLGLLHGVLAVSGFVVLILFVIR